MGTWASLGVHYELGQGPHQSYYRMDRAAFVLLAFSFVLIQKSTCQEIGKEPLSFPLASEPSGDSASPLKLSPLPVSAPEPFPPLTVLQSGSEGILPVSGCASCGTGTLSGGLGRMNRGWARPVMIPSVAADQSAQRPKQLLCLRT